MGGRSVYRSRSRERVVPLTETCRGAMMRLYEAMCIIEIPFRIARES